MYILIDENGIVSQKQPNKEDGFVKCPDGVVCGMKHDGGSSYSKGSFSYEAPEKTWQEVKETQRNLIVAHSDMMEIHEREVSHEKTNPENYTISVTQYQEMLDYFQLIRVNDEATHSTPNDAINALQALSLPAFVRA